MNKIHLLHYLTFIILLFFASCDDDYSGSSYESLKGNIEVVCGNNQTAPFGGFLPDSIVIKVSSNKTDSKFLIHCEPLLGNGYNTHGRYYNKRTEFIPDSLGNLTIQWKLDGVLEIQAIKIKLYIDSTTFRGLPIYHKEPFDSVIINANAELSYGWLRASGCRNLHPVAAKIASFDNNTLYINNRGLFSSTDGGLNWKEVASAPENIYITDIQFNSKGWIYLVTVDHGICYSKDLKSWEFINNGIVNFNSLSSLIVGDSIMYVSYNGKELYHTTNNGKFWRLIFSKTNYLKRHPNGKLYRSDGLNNIEMSDDDGASWTKIPLDNECIKSPISDIKISNDGTLYVGCENGQISQISTKTNTVKTHFLNEDYRSTQRINNISFSHGVTYFTIQWGLYAGIYSSHEWKKLELGFDKEISYFYIKKDGTFLILSTDGLYYQSK